MALRAGTERTLKLLGALALGLGTLTYGQTATAGSAATRTLLDKAHSLEARGRMDMAAQTWQQVLLADPNNTDALGGLARAAKFAGDQTLANSYLQRLRAINPTDPGISRAENIMAQGVQLQELQQAGKLASNGNYAQAMNLYRKVFGSNPPSGEWALAYYETEAATEDGRPHAIAGLRTMVEKNPQDSRYQIALGRILTYNPKTRAEGRALLSKHPADPAAADALKQSLVWDAQNPATAGDIRAYLQKHSDVQLSAALKTQEAQIRAQQKASGGARRSGSTSVGPGAETADTIESRARSAEENAAYAALNAKRYSEAEERFKTLLAQNPDNPRALAGIGYVRMNQQNFGGAISFLEQAKQDGARDAGLEKALESARFYYTLGEGSIALNENDLTTAEKQYRSALQMRPAAPEALLGLAGTFMKAQQPAPAEPLYVQYVKLKPADIAGWRGLFLSQYQQGSPQRAIDTERRLPQTVRTQLFRDPDFLRSLSSAYSAVGRDADAQRVLRSALDLPFPADGMGVKVETQLQYASLLLAANRLEQAQGLYRQVLSEDANNISAWQGLVNAEHTARNDALAIQTIESMPQNVYDQAMRESGFLGTAAAAYQSQNKFDIAQSLLERSIAQLNTTGQKIPVGLQVQLASLYLQRNDAPHAFPIFQRVLSENPDRVDAWKGLLTSLHTANRDQEALAEIQQIPPAVRKQLEGDVDYLQTVGNIYNGLNQPQLAMQFLNRVQQKYALQHTQAPADIDIQNAYLLFNGGNDTGLYRQLLILGSRGDLTDEQRRTVQTIWASWAVRRANQAAAAGNVKRSIDILNAAARAFPDNPAVIKALAGGYVRAGLPKQAIAIFKSQDMTMASAADYKAAAGAALSANDLKDAEVWLRYGLNMYPKDAQMLALAAKFEQARGDSGRASDYYRASLAALPPPDPGAELANILNQPMPLNPRPLPSAQQPQDIASLLAPGSEDRPATMAAQTVVERPYLPNLSNGYGQAPVQVNGNTPMTGDSSMQGMTQGMISGTMPNGSVPSYMQNPNSVVREPQRTNRLRDYAPSLQGAPITGFPSLPSSGGMSYAPPEVVLPAATEPLQTAAVSIDDSPASSAYQQQQIQRLTQSAQTADRYQPTVARTEGAQTGEFNGEVFGPYVPYRAPSSAPQPTVSYRPSPVRVPSGATAGQPLPGNTGTRNARNTRAVTGGTSLHPDIAEAQAAAARRRQSDPRSTMTGQSNPPADDLGVSQPQLTYSQDLGTQSGLQYPQIQGQTSQNQTQTMQPSTLPATQPTGQQDSNVMQQPATQLRSYRNAARPSAATPVIPRQQSDSYGQQYPQPLRGQSTPVARSRVRSRSTSAVSGIGQAGAPIFYPAVPTGLTSQPYPDLPPYNNPDAPPTDAQLVARNIPPLRGGYNLDGTVAAGPPLTERQQTELDLATLEASYSAWLGGSGSFRFRSGRSGVERLYDYEVPFEATVVLGNRARFSVVPKAVFLNSGRLDLTGIDPTTAAVPVLGTLPITAITTPEPQFSSGIGGELQMTTQNFGVSVGYTPYEFLVSNIIGRVRWRPGGGHFTLFGDRDSVKETQLAYAGLRDPGSVTPVYSGNIWGGVISTGGGVRLDYGDEKSGFYVSGDGAAITGYHVLDNRKYEGTMGAYFRVKQFPGIGSLNIGGSFFGLHFDHNVRPLTYGNGGYFSPEVYFLGSIPVTFTGNYKKDWHYVASAAFGVQTFHEENTVFYPLDPVRQNGAYSGCTLPQIATHTCATAEIPNNTSTGGNFNIGGQFSYRIADHWYVGASIAANNTNNYTSIQPTVFARYLFRPQYPTEDYPTGLFPVEGLRPLRVP